jgi:putative DNA primase/helicase
VLRDAAEVIQMKTRAPMALCGNSVLAAASLCAQAHGDVQMPYGSAKPLSLFLGSVADTGERKSTVDELALASVRAREAELRPASTW